MTTFKASPGIAIIEPFKDSEAQLITGTKKFQKIKKGKIITIGKALVTDFGALIESSWYGKVGDIVWFNSFDEDYDVITEGTRKFHLVKIQDIFTRV